MVSFGVAPALVMYEWALKDLGKLGWTAAFVYCAGAALRLARFNTNIDVVDKRYFQGLPSPMAAAFVAGLVWVFDDLGIDRELWLSVMIAIHHHHLLSRFVSPLVGIETLDGSPTTRTSMQLLSSSVRDTHSNIIVTNTTLLFFSSC